MLLDFAFSMTNQLKVELKVCDLFVQPCVAHYDYLLPFYSFCLVFAFAEVATPESNWSQGLCLAAQPSIRVHVQQSWFYVSVFPSRLRTFVGYEFCPSLKNKTRACANISKQVANRPTRCESCAVTTRHGVVSLFPSWSLLPASPRPFCYHQCDQISTFHTVNEKKKTSAKDFHERIKRFSTSTEDKTTHVTKSDMTKRQVNNFKNLFIIWHPGNSIQCVLLHKIWLCVLPRLL